MRDIEGEIKKIGTWNFLEYAKKLDNLTGKERMMVEALDHESLAFMRYVDDPTDFNWRNLLYQIESHRVYFYDFNSDYFFIVSDVLDKLAKQ